MVPGYSIPLHPMPPDDLFSVWVRDDLLPVRGFLPIAVRREQWEFSASRAPFITLWCNGAAIASTPRHWNGAYEVKNHFPHKVDDICKACAVFAGLSPVFRIPLPLPLEGHFLRPFLEWKDCTPMRDVIRLEILTRSGRPVKFMGNNRRWLPTWNARDGDWATDRHTEKFLAAKKAFAADLRRFLRSDRWTEMREKAVTFPVRVAA